ncbi:MAG: chemotaxis protein CheB [Snowella sp.]|nr:chemotaxis protein CheB [Snowella sp.]
MVNTVLCIGASTYSEGTPQKINEALKSSNFLEKGSVIFTCHKYFPLYSEPGYPRLIRQQLNQWKEEIKEQHFPDCQLFFIDDINTLYNIQSGYIYILPDTFFTSVEYSEYTPFEVGIHQENNNLRIQCFARNFNLMRYYELFTDDIRYLPCIDLIMGQFSKTDVSNKLGLILAGMEQDGAKGLTEIGRKGGKIAIQDQDEYCEISRTKPDPNSLVGGKIKIGNKDMPKAAISEAEKHHLDYELISLYGKENCKSLTDWLQENIS